MSEVRHLLHVGFPKTGSKLLQLWFRDHRDIRFARWAFAGYRKTLDAASAIAAGGTRPWHVTSYEGFAFPFQGVDSFDRLDHFLPDRARQEEICLFLASVLRADRVLIITRGYRGLLASLHAEAVRGGAAYGFAEFCAAFLDRARGGANPLDYDHVLEIYGRAFGKERLLVLPYERLSRDPDAFFRVLEDSLGLGRQDPPRRRVHPSFSPAELRFYGRLNRLARPLLRPAGERASRLYAAGLRRNLLAAPIRLLAPLFGGNREPRDEVPAQLLDAFRGTASRLASMPHYQGLGDDYLF